MSGQTAKKAGSTNKAKTRIDWGMVVIGILLVLASLVLLTWPGATLLVIAVAAGIALIVAGIMDIVTYGRMKDTVFASGWTLAAGILDILIGIVFLFQPVATAVALPWMAALFMVFYGAFAIAMGATSRQTSGWGWAVFAGIVSILLGVLFFLQPTSFVLFFALFVAFRGIMMIVSGFTTPRAIDYL